jgi:hypothetical protein
MVASVRPWKPWSKVMISEAPSLKRLPHLRASLMAPSLASAPEFVKKTRRKAECSVMRLASRSAGSL